jgi:hypothetical protein
MFYLDKIGAGAISAALNEQQIPQSAAHPS